MKDKIVCVKPSMFIGGLSDFSYKPYARYDYNSKMTQLPDRVDPRTDQEKVWDILSSTNNYVKTTEFDDKLAAFLAILNNAKTDYLDSLGLQDDAQ